MKIYENLLSHVVMVHVHSHRPGIGTTRPQLARPHLPWPGDHTVHTDSNLAAKSAKPIHGRSSSDFILANGPMVQW